MSARWWLPVLASSLLAGCVGDGRIPAPRAAPPPPDAATNTGPGSVDVVLMIDNTLHMAFVQRKLAQQLPQFFQRLQDLPAGPPDLHVAIVSSDMGAPSDEQLGCATPGDDGRFQASSPSCALSPLVDGATFVSNVGGAANYTGTLADVLSCIVPLGTIGCGFRHQLASVARALGADGQPAPAQNQGFLRPEAVLAILLLTDEDDCSAPPDTTLYSLNGGTQSVSNPLGPIANYRCNRFGHLCRDPAGAQPGALSPPPLAPPADATGDPLGLALSDCVPSDAGTGLLTPVSSYVDGIKALKTDPSRIVVGAIAGPVAPYGVRWVPPQSAPPSESGQLWPNVLHSCGPVGNVNTNPAVAQQTTDPSFGNPAVRVNQWVQAFGDNGVIGSICDTDYGATLDAFAAKIAQRLAP